MGAEPYPTKDPSQNNSRLPQASSFEIPLHPGQPDFKAGGLRSFLFLKRADVSDQVLDVGIGETVAESLHLDLSAVVLQAVLDAGRGLIVGEALLVLGIGHVLHAVHAPGFRVARSE